MENLEYFRILVTGYYKHSSFLKDHIYREFKKAEKNFITKDEFFTRCDYIIKWLENEFDKRVNEQKKDWYDVLHYLKHEPEKANCGEIPIDQHILQLENQLKTISRNNFPVNLRHIRGIPADYYMDFQNILEYSDLQYIETAIKQAMGILDDIAKDIKEPEQPTGSDYSALYNELIKKYFSDISKDEFNEVLNYKRLPNGKEKIKWIKDNGADAFRFKEFIKFTIKEMNDCFSFPFGKLEGHDKPKHNGTKTDLSRILKRLQPQK